MQVLYFFLFTPIAWLFLFINKKINKESNKIPMGFYIAVAWFSLIPFINFVVAAVGMIIFFGTIIGRFFNWLFNNKL
jgi:predicted membrane channel-forming protein YqfA (hemolysin III family)